MAARFNETKAYLLKFLLENGSATSAEIAEYLSVTRAGASSYLKKLHRQGLLGRGKLGEESGSQERVYYLTNKGFDRLEWLHHPDGY